MAQRRPTRSRQQDEKCRCGWSVVPEHQVEQCVSGGEGTGVAEVYCQPILRLSFCTSFNFYVFTFRL